jgi:hypothetical protein
MKERIKFRSSLRKELIPIYSFYARKLSFSLEFLGGEGIYYFPLSLPPGVTFSFLHPYALMLLHTVEWEWE